MENVIEQIIELIYQNPCLYDKRDDKYKDVKLKENIWQDVAKQTNLSVKECKVKWKSLRDRYRKQKMAEDVPSGSSQKLGAPWKHMQSLGFLAEPMEPASAQPTRKRKSDELFTEVLMAMKQKIQ